MNKRILIFSRDPGGANTVFPLIEPLNQAGYQCLVYGKDMALEIYLKNGIQGFDIMEKIKILDVQNIQEFLTNQSIIAIITGTSGNDFTERYIWKAAENLNIPSFAILDQWMNYGIRFSKYSLNQYNKYNSNREHPFLPSKIFVMDSFAYNQSLKTGIASDKLVISGQPYFDFLYNSKKLMTQSQIDSIRKSLNCGDDEILLTYASEPLSSSYENSKKIWGFDEKSIFSSLLLTLNDICDSIPQKLKIVIRTHPREEKNSYSTFLSSLKTHSNISISVDNHQSSLNSIIASDLVVGMSSMFLIEAAYLKKPIISILIGLKNDNPFILDRIGYVKSTKSLEMLKSSLIAFFENKSSSKMDLNLNHGSIDFIIKFLKENLCQN